MDHKILYSVVLLLAVTLLQHRVASQDPRLLQFGDGSQLPLGQDPLLFGGMPERGFGGPIGRGFDTQFLNGDPLLQNGISSQFGMQRRFDAFGRPILSGTSMDRRSRRQMDRRFGAGVGRGISESLGGNEAIFNRVGTNGPLLEQTGVLRGLGDRNNQIAFTNPVNGAMISVMRNEDANGIVNTRRNSQRGGSSLNGGSLLNSRGLVGAGNGLVGAGNGLVGTANGRGLRTRPLRTTGFGNSLNGGLANGRSLSGVQSNRIGLSRTTLRRSQRLPASTLQRRTSGVNGRSANSVAGLGNGLQSNILQTNIDLSRAVNPGFATGGLVRNPFEQMNTGNPANRIFNEIQGVQRGMFGGNQVLTLNQPGQAAQQGQQVRVLGQPLPNLGHMNNVFEPLPGTRNQGQTALTQGSRLLENRVGSQLQGIGTREGIAPVIIRTIRFPTINRVQNNGTNRNRGRDNTQPFNAIPPLSIEFVDPRGANDILTPGVNDQVLTRENNMIALSGNSRQFIDNRINGRQATRGVNIRAPQTTSQQSQIDNFQANFRQTNALLAPPIGQSQRIIMPNRLNFANPQINAANDLGQQQLNRNIQNPRQHQVNFVAQTSGILPVQQPTFPVQQTFINPVPQTQIDVNTRARTQNGIQVTQVNSVHSGTDLNNQVLQMQPGTFQQPGSFQQPGTFQQPGSFQQPGTIQQPGTFQQPGNRLQSQIQGANTIQEPRLRLQNDNFIRGSGGASGSQLNNRFTQFQQPGILNQNQISIQDPGSAGPSVDWSVFNRMVEGWQRSGVPASAFSSEDQRVIAQSLGVNGGLDNRNSIIDSALSVNTDGFIPQSDLLNQGRGQRMGRELTLDSLNLQNFDRRGPLGTGRMTTG